MTVYFNREPIEVTPVYDGDGNLIGFKDKNRNYQLGAVIYDGCPQTKYQ